jgi:SAM-dependent methyltransferase
VVLQKIKGNDACPREFGRKEHPEPLGADFFWKEKMDWYSKLYKGREFFADRDEEKAYREKQKGFTRPEVQSFCRLLGLAPGSKILDVYCGNGRHAVELAQKGFKVVGIDISFSRISFAHNWARDEGAGATFLIGDAQALPLRQTFEAVLILGGSFTHWQEEETNISLLQGFRKVLKPGGLLLIDNPNPLRFWRIQHPEGTLAKERKVLYFDLPLGQGETSGYVRYYGIETMKRLLQKAAMEAGAICGDRTGRPYSFDSPRMIVIGQPAA